MTRIHSNTIDWQNNATQFLQLDAHSLEVRCITPRQSHKLTLVLLHEGLGCNALWRQFPEQLAESTACRVLLYSRAGYGQSSPVALPRPLDYMYREAVDVLPAVLDAAGIEKTVLLGHSDGGSIAALHAGNVSDPRVRGLILMAPHFFTEALALESIKLARVNYETGDLRARLSRYHNDVDIAFRGWNDAWLDADFVSWNIEDSIPHIRVPVLAIQGRDDPYGSAAQLDTLATHLGSPCEIRFLDDCKHTPHLEQPEQTQRLIQQFLEHLLTQETGQTAPTSPSARHP